MKKTLTLTALFTALSTAPVANAQTELLTQAQTDTIWMTLSGVALAVLLVFIGYSAYRLIKKWSSPVEGEPAPAESD